ncbi:MAG: hypothetical protein GWP08_10535 [Nitrospiraceae bacterium]|nr:hypothetical protein [Nitrospiraceae bacterium]
MTRFTSIGCAFLLALCEAPVTAASEPVFVDAGYDVGDGLVLDDLPYDPKAIDEMLFISPSPAHPFYEIALPLGDWSEGAGATVSEVKVNGLAYPAFNVYVDGLARYQSDWITRESATSKNVAVVVRAPWHNKKRTTVELKISVSGGESVTKRFEGKAPATGGAPKGWRRYQSVVLHERAGLERVNEPVEFSLAARAENCGDLARELRIYAVDTTGKALTPVDCQTFDAQEFPGSPPGTSNENYLQHPSRSINAVFLASVAAHASKVYLAFYDNPEAPKPKLAATDLVVTGPALGAMVENQYYKVKLHDNSGQIASFELKGREENPVPLLTNSYSRAVHWNPDSFSDNGKWGHTFAWDPPEQTVVTARGPILFRITNSGRMPDYTPQIWASVSYSFYAGAPYVKSSSVIEVRDPVNISAIRNGEIVLDTHLVTHLVWQEKTGERRIVRAMHGPNHQDEWAARVDHDVPWVALTNELEDYGLGAVVEASVAFDPKRGEAVTHRPAYYLYAHHQWGIPLTYFTRAWVYPFSDYQRGPIIPVKAGSTYVSRMAFVPFLLHSDGDRYADIEGVSQQIKHPLAQRWGR